MGTESGRSCLVIECILSILAKEEHSEAVLWKAFWEAGKIYAASLWLFLRLICFWADQSTVENPLRAGDLHLVLRSSLKQAELSRSSDPNMELLVTINRSTKSNGGDVPRRIRPPCEHRQKIPILTLPLRPAVVRSPSVPNSSTFRILKNGKQVTSITNSRNTSIGATSRSGCSRSFGERDGRGECNERSDSKESCGCGGR